VFVDKEGVLPKDCAGIIPENGFPGYNPGPTMVLRPI
jgi:hypothetical protein